MSTQAARVAAATHDEQRQRHHAETSDDVTFDSRSPSVQDTPPLQTPPAESSLRFRDTTPVASIKFRSVSDVVAYSHDDEVQETIKTNNK